MVRPKKFGVDTVSLGIRIPLAAYEKLCELSKAFDGDKSKTIHALIMDGEVKIISKPPPMLLMTDVPFAVQKGFKPGRLMHGRTEIRSNRPGDLPADPRLIKDLVEEGEEKYQKEIEEIDDLYQEDLDDQVHKRKKKDILPLQEL